MEFALNAVQESLQDIVRSYCREKCSFAERELHVREWAVSSLRRWKDFAELGLLGIVLSEDVGGSGLSMTDCSVVLHEFGRSLVPEPFWACAIMAGTLIDATTSDRRRSLLQTLIAGGAVFAVGFEDQAAVDERPTTTIAKRQRSGQFVVEGGKQRVVGGPIATTFIILADAREGNGEQEGLALFVIDANAPNLSRRNYRSIDGSLVSDVRLDGVLVAADAKLADGDEAIGAIAKAMDAAMVAICAEAVGVSEAILWATRDHLCARRQFGTTLRTMQALQHRMADMFIELEQSRSLLYRALSSLTENQQSRRYMALAAYLQLCRAGAFICRNGVQLHGASGITDELPIGHYFKRQVVIEQLFGGVDLVKERFASLTIDQTRGAEWRSS